MKSKITMFALLACLVLAAPAYGGSVLLGNTGTIVGGAGVFSDNFLAQGFSLTKTINVSAVNLFIGGFGGPGQFTLWLVDALGPSATSTNVLEELLLNEVSTPGGNAQLFSFALTHVLDPGSYWLVISTQNGQVNWWQPDSDIPSTVGSIEDGLLFTQSGHPLFPLDSSFPPASTWGSTVGSCCNDLGFQIVGDVAVVPAPSTLVLCGIGLVAFWLRRREQAASGSTTAS